MRNSFKYFARAFVLLTAFSSLAPSLAGRGRIAKIIEGDPDPSKHITTSSYPLKYTVKSDSASLYLSNVYPTDTNLPEQNKDVFATPLTENEFWEEAEKEEDPYGMAAYHIYQGQFEEACHYLKTIQYSEMILLKALKTQLKNPQLPKKLISLLGKGLRNSLSFMHKKSFKGDEKFYYAVTEEYKAVLDCLLEKHPRSRKKLRHLIKASNPNHKSNPMVNPEKSLK